MAGGSFGPTRQAEKIPAKIHFVSSPSPVKPNFRIAAREEKARLLLAVPLRAPRVEAQEGQDGRLRLCRAIDGRPGWRRALGRKLGFRKTARIDLDVYGSFFWKAIDGQADLSAISQQMAERFQLNPEQCASAVIDFAKSLMVRGLVLIDPRATTKQ
jgi:hypothetical protein